MHDIDFTVTKANWVIHRPNTPSWHADNLLYSHEYIMAIVLEGEILYTINNISFSAFKNDVLIFPPGIARKGKSNPIKPCAFISVSFCLSGNEISDNFFNRDYLFFPQIGERLRNKFYNVAYDWESKNPLYQIRCKNIISSLLYDIIYYSLPHNDIPHLKELQSAQTYIQANFRNDINIEALALRLNLSPSYFRKLFRRAYGVSPKQYIINLRINTAKDLLLAGEANIGKTAALSGFDDIYYFSTLFKKQTGLSPTQYVKSSR